MVIGNSLYNIIVIQNLGVASLEPLRDQFYFSATSQGFRMILLKDGRTTHFIVPQRVKISSVQKYQSLTKFSE